MTDTLKAIKSAIVPKPMPSAQPAQEQTDLGDAVIERGVDTMMRGIAAPYMAAKDAYEQLPNVIAAGQVLRQDTGASTLAVGEAAKVTLEGEVSIEGEGAFATVEGSISTERTVKGWTVTGTLDTAVGARVALRDNLELDAGLVLGAEITVESKTAQQANADIGRVKGAFLAAGAMGTAGGAATMGIGGQLGTAAGFTSDAELLRRASKVDSTIALRGAAELGLWEAKGIGGVKAAAAEFAVSVETDKALHVVVTKDEQGKKQLQVEASATLTTEAELETGADVLDDFALAGVHLAGASEVTVTERVTWPLADDFDMANATSPRHLMQAVQGPGKSEFEVGVNATVGAQQVETTVTVSGGPEQAFVVAAAGLGVPGAAEEAAAQRIQVSGEVVRKQASTLSASASFDDVFEVGVECERTQTVETRSVSDVKSFVGESLKAGGRALYGAHAVRN